MWFWPWVGVQGPDDCWEWTRSRFKGPGKPFDQRYGRVWDRRVKKYYGTHRIALSLSLGIAVADLQGALHHCDNPPCCNPAHLYNGTTAQNAQDAIARGRWPSQRKTHCPQDHEYTEDNIKWVRRANGARHRQCRICVAAYQHAYWIRQREVSV